MSEDEQISIRIASAVQEGPDVIDAIDKVKGSFEQMAKSEKC